MLILLMRWSMMMMIMMGVRAMRTEEDCGADTEDGDDDDSSNL